MFKYSIIKEGGNNTYVGSLSWMAPEIALKQEYSYKIDIWSLGITALEIANGKPPYKDISPVDFMVEMESNRIPSLYEDDKIKWSDEFKNFVKDCLIKNPQLRPSANDLLQKHTKFLDKAKNKEYLVENVLKGCPNLRETFPRKLKGNEQYFINEPKNENNIDEEKDKEIKEIKNEIKDIINKKESNDVGDEMNADMDENIGSDNLESLKRKLNKNINDLKGIVSDQNEEEC